MPGHFRNFLPMLKPIRQHTQRQRLHMIDRLVARAPIGQGTRQGRHFRDPSPIIFLFGFNG